MSDLSSSDKEQSAGVGSASGENSCVSSGQNTDSSSSGGVGGAEERKARAKRSESRQSANNSGSDTSTRGAPVEPRLVCNVMLFPPMFVTHRDIHTGGERDLSFHFLYLIVCIS